MGKLRVFIFVAMEMKALITSLLHRGLLVSHMPQFPARHSQRSKACDPASPIVCPAFDLHRYSYHTLVHAVIFAGPYISQLVTHAGF